MCFNVMGLDISLASTTQNKLGIHFMNFCNVIAGFSSVPDLGG